MVPVFCINRPCDTERRAFMDGQFSRLGIDPVYKKGLSPEAIPGYIAYNFPPSALSPGEMGCYASHMSAWWDIMTRRMPHALVVEDDAILCPEIAERLDRVLAEIQEGWDFVHISNPKCRAYKLLAQVDDTYSVVRHSRIPAGAVGYLISQSGARKLLRPRHRKWPVDVDTRRPWVFGLDSYGVLPPLIGHHAFPSVISPVPKAGRSRGRRGISLNPLHTPYGAVFNMRKLGLAGWVQALASNVGRKLGGTT
jgi:glycosyl transferase family 25